MIGRAPTKDDSGGGHRPMGGMQFLLNCLHKCLPPPTRESAGRRQSASALSAQLGGNFSGGLSGALQLVGPKANRGHHRVPSASVPLGNAGQVVAAAALVPWIGADRNFCALAAATNPDGVLS